MKTQSATTLYRDLNRAVYDYNRAAIIDAAAENGPAGLVGLARQVVAAVKQLPPASDAREEHKRDSMLDYAQAIIDFYKPPVIRKTSHCRMRNVS